MEQENALVKNIITIIWLFVLIIAGLFFTLVMAAQDRGPFSDEPSNEFLREEEAVVIRPAKTSGGGAVGAVEPAEEESAVEVLPVKNVLFEYVEVTGGCDPYFVGDCLNARSGPGTDYPIITRLRNGIVLKIGGLVERNGSTWYKIVFDELLRYPERAQGDWFVSADYVEVLLNEGNKNIKDGTPSTTTKRIVVDRSDQTLQAYDGDVLFMEAIISTGIELTPTPRGTFTIFKKTPSRYMQGPIPGLTSKYYDLPGVPWNLYFTQQGAVIHGAYWHNNFGSPSSSGCVNLISDEARTLYNWADVGTKVIVQD